MPLLHVTKFLSECKLIKRFLSMLINVTLLFAFETKLRRFQQPQGYGHVHIKYRQCSLWNNYSLQWMGVRFLPTVCLGLRPQEVLAFTSPRSKTCQSCVSGIAKAYSLFKFRSVYSKM